jgi:hypothetical protein
MALLFLKARETPFAAAMLLMSGAIGSFLFWRASSKRFPLFHSLFSGVICALLFLRG